MHLIAAKSGGINIGIDDEIINSFFKSIEDEIPGPIIVSLKSLLNSNDIISKEEIFGILKEGDQNADKNH